MLSECCGLHKEPWENILLYFVIPGGTVDITAHEVLINGEVKEISPPSGGPWGGFGVNRKFIAALAKVFGQDFINHMKATSAQQWLSFAGLFETAKKDLKADGKKKLRLALPYSFNQKFQELEGKSLEDAIKECGDKEISFASGVLVIGPDKVKSFFDETCTQTVKHVKKLFKKRPALEDVKYIVLVGGYGNSPVLQDACTEAFGNKRKVLVPLSAQTAIIEGAVLFGHQPNVISVRVARYTYGCQADLVFDKEKHDKSRQYTSKRDGQLRCHGTFRPFVNMNEELKNPEEKVFTVHPKSKEEKRITVNFLKAEKEQVTYCDEDGVTNVGKIKLKSRSGYFGEDIEIKVTFGHTELLVEARDTSKGDDFLVKAYLDFSSN